MIGQVDGNECEIHSIGELNFRQMFVLGNDAKTLALRAHVDS